MKILFFIDTLESGGRERRLTELLKALKSKKNIQFELVVMSKSIHYTEVLDLKIPIHYIVRKAKKDVSVFKKFYSLCKKYKPDIIHSWDSMTAIYLIPACKILKIKLINGMVADAPEKQNVLNKNWLRAKLSFPHSYKIVGNSKAGLVAYNSPESKSIVIYNGFDFKRTMNLANKNLIREQLNVESNYVVGMVATFSDYKDYKTYFKAAQIILKSRKDIVFLAIGKGTDSPMCENLVDEEYKSFFRFLGKKSGIESIINAIDICVLATFTEGISNSILEYMALEKPVVATDGGGTNEILIDGATGFLVSQSNPEELASKINILLNDDKLRRAMGTEGKKRISEVFSIEKMVNQYIHLYEKIVAA